MQADRHDEGRPLAEERPHNVTAGDPHSLGEGADSGTHHCIACGRAITSPESVRVGLGKTCRRRLRAGLRDADPAVVAAYAIVLGAA